MRMQRKHSSCKMPQSSWFLSPFHPIFCKIAVFQSDVIEEARELTSKWLAADNVLAPPPRTSLLIPLLLNLLQVDTL